MKTFIPKSDSIDKKWHIIDLNDVVLGRAACKVADILRGKNKTIFTPHMDCGDHVIIINAEKVKVNGKNKKDQLRYYNYSGYQSGLRTTKFSEMIEKKPGEVFKLCVKRMLPKNKLGRKIYKKLYVYAGENHPHTAQQPQELKLF